MSKKSSAIIILHEIYGINSFIQSVVQFYQKKGFDVFYPNFLEREAFLYQEEKVAYRYFNTFVGFDCYVEIMMLIENLKKSYQKVYVFGYSVGATIGWRCSISDFCDGIIGVYGSRIRDYLEIKPICPVLLLFANQDSFDLDTIIKKLDHIEKVKAISFSASHGFMDKYSTHFDKKNFLKAENLISDFLKIER